MSLHRPRTFASDNWSGIHPDILAAIGEANVQHAPAYGEDDYTKLTEKLLKKEFGDDISTHLVLTGTAANVIAVTTLLQPGESVLCAETAHVYEREDSVHEYFSGTRFLLVPSRDGKITPKSLEYRMQSEDAKRANIGVLVLTNGTERGTVYSPKEIRSLTRYAHKQGMLVYVDGARLANAAVALDVSLADLTINVGVDAFSFGGTKNGMLGGEAIIFRDGKRFEKRASTFRKLGLQDASKLRFVAAQFQTYLHNSLWKTTAYQANLAAAYLAKELSKRGVPLVQRQDINQVWASFSASIAQSIVNEHYGHRAGSGLIRFVTSWDTEIKDIQQFLVWLDRQRPPKMVS